MGTATINHSPDEALHVDIMRAIARDFHELPMVLKGGTALLLCYGLDRFSEDLDFDAPKKFNIAGRIEKILARFTQDFDVKTVKDTETVQRLKAHYRNAAGDRLLKIETSFRKEPDAQDVIVSDGIKTYRIGTLIDQKIAALIGRTKARDLYDVAFLARTYRADFHPNAIQKLSEVMADIDAIESRFEEAFEDDDLLDVAELPSLILQIKDRTV
jgi:predicted nucleotidyltransferase component of viral defense system